MCKTYSQRPSAVMEITDSWLAFDFDLAITSFAVIVGNRLEERSESLQGGKTVSKPKYTLEEALGIRRQANLITTHEQAVAMGFIPMNSNGERA